MNFKRQDVIVSLISVIFSNFFICSLIKHVRCLKKGKKKRKKKSNPFRIYNTDTCRCCNPELCAKNSLIDYRGLKLLLNIEAVESGLEQNHTKTTEYKLEKAVNVLNIHAL